MQRDTTRSKQNRVFTMIVITVLVGSLLCAAGLSFTSMDAQAHPWPAGVPTTFQESSYYTNTPVANLWVRQNGSLDVFSDPYPYADPPAVLGENYFRTKSLSVNVAEYGYTNLTNEDFWGADTEMIVLLGGGGGLWGFTEATARDCADAAKLNAHIVGIMWDDYTVGWESHANMSRYYEVIHHEDANLTQGPLVLYLTIYNFNYYRDAPNDWASIHGDYDGIVYWFWPHDPGVLWQDFAGYADGYLDMRSQTGGDCTYWLGVYSHYYYVGSYPSLLLQWQMGEALRLIDQGYADKLSVLETFWIRNEPVNAAIIRTMLDQEYAQGYSTTISYPGVVTVNGDGDEVSSGVDNLEIDWAYSGYLVSSSHYQTILVNDTGYTDPQVQCIQTGELLHKVTLVSGDVSFIALPGFDYRLYDQEYTAVTYTSDQYITTPTIWDGKLITFSANLIIDAKLTVTNSIIRFNHFAYQHSSVNGTDADNGLYLDSTGELCMQASMIESTDRTFAWFAKLANETSVGSKRISIQNSTLARFDGLFTPRGYTYINDTVFYMPSNNGGSTYGFKLDGSLYYEGRFSHNLFLFADEAGCGSFIYPMDMDRSGVDVWTWNGNMNIGGKWPLYVDNSYSTAGTVTNFRNSVIAFLSDVRIADDARLTVLGPINADGTVEIYEALTIHAYASAISYSILDADDNPVATGTVPVDSHEHQEIHEATWRTGFVLDYLLDWPLQIEVTSTVPSDHLMRAADYSDAIGQASAIWGSPRYLEFNESKALIQYGQNGVQFRLESDLGFSTGGWLDESRCWGVRDNGIGTNIEYEVPSVVNVILEASDGIEVVNISYSSDKDVSVSLNAPTNATVDMTVLGLIPSDSYRIEVDGATVRQSAPASQTGNLSYSLVGDGLPHQVTFTWTSSLTSLLAFILAFGIAAIVLSGIGVVISGSSKKG